MKKNIKRLIGVGIIFVAVFVISQYVSFKKAGQIIELDLIKDDYYTMYENKILKFIEDNYLLSSGVMTTDMENKTVVTNEQLLYMTYLLEKDKSDEFEAGIRYIESQLVSDEGMVAIGRENERIERFSTYDQMKFFKLLYKAHAKWGQEKYKNMGMLIEKHLYEQYIKEKKIYPYYKLQENETIDTPIPLYFLDLNSLGLLGTQRNNWISIYNESKQLIQNAYINERFPFYHTSYDYGENTYNKDYKANMLESVLIVFNLAEVKLHKEATIDWLKMQLKKGAIYTEYNKETGLPIEHTENAGIYGVVAQIGKIIGDIELYTLAIERMLSLQIKEEGHPEAGAFQSFTKEEINLYENLNALLAF